MDEEVIKELTQRIKELEWEVNHLQESGKIIIKKGPEGPFL